MLIASPHSSLLWIQYMAFHLQLGEAEKSRDVAHRALKTIMYREEAERLNVWVALLNMENIYGTQANIDDAFNRANQNCDSFKIHLHMAEIYARSSKLQEAEDVFMRMTKKFAARQDVWIKYAIFHYKNANCELARKLLIRSLGSLEKKEREYKHFIFIYDNFSFNY
jgi:rRNA biogenesis protein RRP5